MRISDGSSDVCSSDLGGGESQTMNTKVACTKLFGSIQRRDLGDTHLWTHNSWTHVMSDHAVIAYILPLAPDKTLVRTKWLVHADAVEGVDYSVPELTEVWLATNSQDQKRSEEHTSELQSLMRISYAVFCLKKKKNTKKP